MNQRKEKKRLNNNNHADPRAPVYLFLSPSLSVGRHAGTWDGLTDRLGRWGGWGRIKARMLL
jgi:hypothetical protein